MLKIKDVLDIKLKDDETLDGGVAFEGETVRHLISDEDMLLNEEDSVSELNKVLRECGIKELEPITRKEFNERYLITAKIVGSQAIYLAENNYDTTGNFSYGEISGADSVSYTVLDTEDFEEVMAFDSGDELDFFEALKQELVIVD